MNFWCMFVCADSTVLPRGRLWKHLRSVSSGYYSIGGQNTLKSPKSKLDNARQAFKNKIDLIWASSNELALIRLSGSTAGLAIEQRVYWHALDFHLF